jgi:hypothetical protein
MLAIDNPQSIRDYVCLCGKKTSDTTRYELDADRFFTCFDCHWAIRYSTRNPPEHYIYYSLKGVIVYRDRFVMERYPSVCDRELKLRLIEDGHYFHPNKLIKRIYKLWMLK